MQKYDVIIIGGGPAGLTAGIYAARAELKTLIIEKGNVGGQIIVTQEIENYPPFFENMSGMELMMNWRKHALHAGVEIAKDEIIDMQLDGYEKKLKAKSSNEYLAKSIIFAPGATPRKLGAKGEKLYTGKGVSYCATCDGGFFRGLEIAVVGSGNSAIEEGIFLTRFASKVTIIVSSDEGEMAASKYAIKKAQDNEKINFIFNSTVEEIIGTDLVTGVCLKNNRTNIEETLAVEGVFIFVGVEPKTEFLQDKIELDQSGYILASNSMETNIAGVYAAGDALKKDLRQVITAASDGAIAAVSAEKFVEEADLWQEKVLNSKTPVAILFYKSRETKDIEIRQNLENLSEKLNFNLITKPMPRNTKLAENFAIKSTPAVLLVNGEKQEILIEDAIKEENITDFVKN